MSKTKTRRQRQNTQGPRQTRPTPATTTERAAATPPALTLVTQSTPADTDKPTVELRKPLPIRHHNDPWMTDAQGYATLAALLIGITTPHIHAWTDTGNNNAARTHMDGQLDYDHTTHTLTWIAACPQGIQHAYPLHAPGDIEAANRHLGWCTDRHTPTGPAVRTLAQAFADRALGDTLTRSTNPTAETQPLSRDQIDAVLTARAATEQPKEHPAP